MKRHIHFASIGFAGNLKGVKHAFKEALLEKNSFLKEIDLKNDINKSTDENEIDVQNDRPVLTLERFWQLSVMSPPFRLAMDIVMDNFGGLFYYDGIYRKGKFSLNFILTKMVISKMSLPVCKNFSFIMNLLIIKIFFVIRSLILDI